MNAFIFDAWRMSIRPYKNGEAVNFYFLRTVANKDWILAIRGIQLNKGRICYEVDYDFYKAYSQHVGDREGCTMWTKRAVYSWLDCMSHYGMPENTNFFKVQITDAHLNGPVDEVLYNHFITHAPSDYASIKLWNGGFGSLVDPRRANQWWEFLRKHVIKPGYTVFFYYLCRRDYGTVIFNRKRELSQFDDRNELPKDVRRREFYESDSSVETDEDGEDMDEEYGSESYSSTIPVSEDGVDEIVYHDMELDSDGDFCLPTLRQMNAEARIMKSIPSSPSRGYSAASSDGDSVKSF